MISSVLNNYFEQLMDRERAFYKQTMELNTPSNPYGSMPVPTAATKSLKYTIPAPPTKGGHQTTMITINSPKSGSVEMTFPDGSKMVSDTG